MLDAHGLVASSSGLSKYPLSITPLLRDLLVILITIGSTTITIFRHGCHGSNTFVISMVKRKTSIGSSFYKKIVFFLDSVHQHTIKVASSSTHSAFVLPCTHLARGFRWASRDRDALLATVVGKACH